MQQCLHELLIDKNLLNFSIFFAGNKDSSKIFFQIKGNQEIINNLQERLHVRDVWCKNEYRPPGMVC